MLYIVPLNYNFICTCMDMRGNTTQAIINPITCLFSHGMCNLLCATDSHTCMPRIATRATYVGTHVQSTCIILLTKMCQIHSTAVKATHSEYINSHINYQGNALIAHTSDLSAHMEYFVGTATLDIAQYTNISHYS